MKGKKLTAVLLAVLLAVSAFPLTAFAGGGSFWLQRVTEEEVVVYSSSESFAFEVEPKNAAGDVRYYWYRIDANGRPVDLRDNGEPVIIGYGQALYMHNIPDEKMNERLYYRCMATDGSENAYVDFNCILYPIGYEDDYEGPVDRIAIDKLPDKQVYNQGEAVDLSGLSYDIYYADGGHAGVYVMDNSSAGNLTWQPAVLNDYGTQVVSVNYNGASDRFTVTVNKVEGFVPGDYAADEEYDVDLELLEAPDKLNYYAGEEIDLSGIKCRLWTSMGFRDITDPSEFVTFPKIADGMGPMTVSVEYKGHFAVSYEINVEMINDFTDQEYEVDLELVNEPKKKEYIMGDPIDLAGIKCRLYTTLGFIDIDDPAEFTVSPAYASGLGTQTVTVSYRNVVFVTYDISVDQPKLPLITGKTGNPFTDVPEEAYYAGAVDWAYSSDPQVTDGNGKDKFMPYQLCTRGQVVTFLWRAMGCPEPENLYEPFDDVDENDYFYKPVIWAVSRGITDGTSKTTFSPNSQCKCSHILTFLWRTIGRPGDTGAEDTNEWWADALRWAEGMDLLEDTVDPEDGSYNVQGFCPRCEVVTYLYRAVQMMSGASIQ